METTPLKPGRALRFCHWLFSWRSVRRALLGLVGLATLVALFYTEENIRGKWAWSQYVKAKAAQGEKLDFAAFTPTPVPDDQNLAMCPLFKPIFNYPYGDAAVKKEAVKGLERLQQLSPTWSVWKYHEGRALIGGMPPEMAQRYGITPEMAQRLGSTNLAGALPKDPERDKLAVRASEIGKLLGQLTNGWINLTAWQAYYQTGTNLTGGASNASPAADVLLALHYLEPDLADLQREAARRPLDRWTTDGRLLPSTRHIRDIVSALRLRAAARLATGDSDGGTADIELGLRMVESLRDDPYLVTQLARTSYQELILQPLREGLARHQFSEAQLASLQQRLARIDLLAAYQNSLRANRADRTYWLRFTKRDVPWPDMGEEDIDGSGEALILFFKVSPSGWLYQNVLSICRLYEERLLMVDPAKRTVYPARALEAEKAVIRPKGARKASGEIRVLPAFYDRLHHPFSVLTSWFSIGQRYGGPTGQLHAIAYGQTQIDEAVFACALERHHLAHRNYPETLAALVPQYFAALPDDVIGGQPLKYRRAENDRFLLYSVGWNGQDDGGKIAFNNDNPPKPTAGDWVWIYPQK